MSRLGEYMWSITDGDWESAALKSLLNSISSAFDFRRLLRSELKIVLNSSKNGGDDRRFWIIWGFTVSLKNRVLNNFTTVSPYSCSLITTSSTGFFLSREALQSFPSDNKAWM